MYEFDMIARLQHFWKTLQEHALIRHSAPSGSGWRKLPLHPKDHVLYCRTLFRKILLDDIAGLDSLKPQWMQPSFKSAWTLRCLDISRNTDRTQPGISGGFLLFYYRSWLTIRFSTLIITQSIYENKGCMPRQYIEKSGAGDFFLTCSDSLKQLFHSRIQFAELLYFPHLATSSGSGSTVSTTLTIFCR